MARQDQKIEILNAIVQVSIVGSPVHPETNTFRGTDDTTQRAREMGIDQGFVSGNVSTIQFTKEWRLI